MMYVIVVFENRRLRPSSRERQSAAFSKISTLRSLFKNLGFGAQNRRLLFTCGRKATTERKKESLRFINIGMRVEGALIIYYV